MTPTTYGRDFAYCLKSHGGVRGFNASLWRFLLRCTLFCHSVATFLTSVSSYEGGCGFEVINDEFIPKLKDLAEDKGLEFCGNYKRNWVSDRYPGAHFQKTGWKFLDLAFQFESVGLDRMVFGFVCKGESNRSDVPTSVWEKVQEHYSISSPIKDKNNDLWIHKDFIGNKNWNNSQAIKNLRNGKTLNNFSIMFDEAIDCVKGLDI